MAHMTIRDGIQQYVNDAGIERASKVQLRETRRAFYAGASHVLAVLFDLGDDAVSEDDGAKVLEALTQEYKNFAIDVKNGRA